MYRLHKKYIFQVLKGKFDDAFSTYRKIIKLYNKKDLVKHFDFLGYFFYQTIKITQTIEEYKNDMELSQESISLLEQTYFDQKENFSKSRFHGSIVKQLYLLNVTTYRLNTAERFLKLHVNNFSAHTSLSLIYQGVNKSFGKIDIREYLKVSQKLITEIDTYPERTQRIVMLYKKSFLIEYNSNIKTSLPVKLAQMIEAQIHSGSFTNTASIIEYLKIKYIFSENERQNIKKYIFEKHPNYITTFEKINTQPCPSLQKRTVKFSNPNIHLDANNKYVKKALALKKINWMISRKIFALRLHPIKDIILGKHPKYIFQNMVLKNTKIFSLLHLKRYQQFWADASTELNRVNPLQKNHNSIIFFVNDYSLVCGANAFPLLLSAKKQGIQIVPTSSRTIDTPTSLERTDPDLFALAGIMDGRINKNQPLKLKLQKPWKIDIKNKFIGFEDLNFFQPLYEFIARYQFDFFYNYETDIFTRFKTGFFMQLIENTINYIEHIEKYAISHDKSIYFVGFAPHFPHNAVYRIYCENRGFKNKLNYIVTAAGYDNYFNNISEAKTQTFCGLNLTTHRDSRSCFLGTKEGFNKYYKNTEVEREAQLDKAKQWINLRRSTGEKSKDLNDHQKRTLSIIDQYKKKGRKIFIANGKVVFDLAVFYTKGIIHNDMSHWITDSVKAMKDSENLLLIKPHPHELNRNLTMTSEPLCGFTSLIKETIPDNVIILGHKDFNLFELMSLVDAALIWNGTSSLEFAIANIPVYVFDEWAFKDYPIGFYKLKTQEEYYNLLKADKIESTPQELRNRAIAFLNYMSSHDIIKENPYAETSSLNFHQFSKSKIKKKSVRKYLQKGNIELDKFIANIIE